MNVKHIYTLSEHLSQLPIADGQLIVLKDKPGMYYDLDGQRHSVKSVDLNEYVTLDSDQTISGAKTFEGLIQINQLVQGKDCEGSPGSHAEGQGSVANTEGSYAHAEGGQTSAIGMYSHSQGEGTVAEGVGSASSGKDSYAGGDYSSANGVNTSAIGEGSFTAGLATTANEPFSAAFGVANAPQAGDVFEIGNGSITDENGDPLPEEDQTFSNAFRVTKDGRAIAQTDLELESGVKLSNREAVSNKVTSITESATDTQYPSALAVKKYVDQLPEPMVYKGTVGTGGTITTLPNASADNNGFTYKVITAGTYAGQSAKVGDTFISKGTQWDLIPSGDEPSGTVTNVAADGTNGVTVTGGPITSSGTLQISGVAATQSAMGMMSSADKKKLDGISESADAVSFTPTLTSGTEVGAITINGTPAKLYAPTATSYGVVSTTADGLCPKRGGTTTKFLRDDGQWAVPPDTDTTYSDFVKSGTGAKSGLVPAPPTTAGTTKYLREDGQWVVPTNTTYSVATQSANGLMSKEDKIKLDNLSSNFVLTDDTTGTKYTLGVNNGVLYIKEVTA